MSDPAVSPEPAGPAGKGRPRRGIRGLWDRLARAWGGLSREAQEAGEEQRSQRRRGTVPISEVEERQRVIVSGILQSVTYSPVDGPVRLVATLWDGTGTLEVRWLGRRTIPGIVVGRHIEAEGTATRHRDHLALVDPRYRILAPEAV